MSPARLLEHFDRLIDTPDAVPRLRRFILDLAVRGKLVEQDPKDEPAGELLGRIEKQRRRLVKDGKIKDPKDLPAVEQAERPYDIPVGWHWTRLGASVNSHSGGGTPSKNNSTYWDGVIHWASVKDIGKTKYVDDTIDRITEAGLANSSSNLIPPGNLIVVTRMGLGKISINRIPVAINQDLRALSLSKLADIDFYYIFFKTASYEGSGLTVKGIKVEELLNFPFPLPPLAEQHRIVAKVDELMALCDELEAAQTKREKRRDRLVAATLHGLNNGDAIPTPSTPSPFEENARFYFNHLPRLTTRPEHIHQLRQTILNLAVRGKLVPQDPNDETADELLSRIEILRTKLLTEGYPNENEANNQLRKQRSQALPAGLAPLPPGWRWATLMQCSALIVDCHNKTAPYSSNGIILLRTTNVRDGKLNLSQPKFVDEQIYTRWSARYRPEAGDILITREAPMGEVCIIPAGMKVCLGQRMMLSKLLPGTIDQKFMLYSLRDPQLMDRVQDKPVGATVQHLRVGGVETLLVALPPLAEQHRIVAKVDELMALCDELEARIASISYTNGQLLKVVLEEVLPGG